MGGPIVDRLKQLDHRNVVGVQFGGRSPDPQCENMRAHMWARLREWLERGRIDKDPQLEADLTGVGYAHNKRDKLVLEGKESIRRRGLASPDHGDALALTFAAPAGRRRSLEPGRYGGRPMFHEVPNGLGWML